MADDTGGGVLNWAADDRLVIASEEDGWQHLYSLSAEGGKPQLLTPGECEAEQWSFSPDRKKVSLQFELRGYRSAAHLDCVDSTAAPGPMTKPARWWNSVEPGHPRQRERFCLSQLPTQQPIRSPRRLCHTIDCSPDTPNTTCSISQPYTTPKDFPADELVTPQQVIFKAADGVEVHGQLFVPRDGKAGEKHPALVFMHGGSMRQMLLGWHYMYYYSNSYAMNQYLANHGYVVLSVNYRSGIGYGRAFREAPGRAGRGATEYRDVVAAGKVFAGVDPMWMRRGLGCGAEATADF